VSSSLWLGLYCTNGFFGTLINLSATDYASRALAADIISKRRNRFFFFFMGTSHSLHFRRLIETTRALVFNIIPYLAMLPNDDVNLSPLQMDVAIPATSFTLWFVYLRLVGYESHGELPMNKRRTSGTKSISRFKKNCLTIMLHESRNDDAILPILVAESTMEMNLITSTGLLCLYPTIASLNQSLFTYGLFSESSDQDAGILGVQILECNSTWPKSCREACPALWRRTFGLNGATFLRFDLGFCTETVATTHYIWRIADFCLNSFCINAPSYL